MTILDHQTQKPLELACRRNSEESGEKAHKPLRCCKQSSMGKSEVRMSSYVKQNGDSKDFVHEVSFRWEKTQLEARPEAIHIIFWQRISLYFVLVLWTA